MIMITVLPSVWANRAPLVAIAVDVAGLKLVLLPFLADAVDDEFDLVLL